MLGLYSAAEDARDIDFTCMIGKEFANTLHVSQLLRVICNQGCCTVLLSLGTLNAHTDLVQT
jgi:hypothetical protein